MAVAKIMNVLCFKLTPLINVHLAYWCSLACTAEGAAGATTTEIGSANAITVSFENTQASRMSEQ